MNRGRRCNPVQSTATRPPISGAWSVTFTAGIAERAKTGLFLGLGGRVTDLPFSFVVLHTIEGTEALLESTGVAWRAAFGTISEPREDATRVRGAVEAEERVGATEECQHL